MFYEYENWAIESACREVEETLDWNRICFDCTKEISISAWWNQDPYYDFCVDHQSGKVILQHCDEDGNEGITEDIGEFRCYYFHKYDPKGNELDVLDNADAISGDLCHAIGSLLHSKKWEEVYDLTTGVLYIDRLYLKPEYRGKKFGYYIFPALIDVFAGRKDSIVTVIPEPTNDMVTDLGKEELVIRGSKEYKLALKKMKNFFKRFGFEPLENGQVWAAAIVDSGLFQ